MAEVCKIGLDLAKHIFQAHGADASGAVLFRKKLRQAQVLTFFATRMVLVDQSLDIEHGPAQLPAINVHQPNAL